MQRVFFSLEEGYIAGYRHGERVEREPISPAPKAESFFYLRRQIRNLFCLILSLHRIFNEAIGRTCETI